MDKENIVPDIIDAAPLQTLDVKFGNKEVNLGNTLTTTDVKDPPTCVHWNASDDKLYLLIMIDPDAPLRRWPFLSQVNHWLITNIPGNKYSEGQVIAEYAPSGPPPGTGLHRYIFLIYEQPKKIELSPISSRIGRMRFSLKNFTKAHNLENPIAGNFFQAKW